MKEAARPARMPVAIALAVAWALPIDGARETTEATTATVSVAEFGAVPNDGRNDIDSLRAALDACRTRRPRTFRIAPGRYDLRDEEAVRLMNQVMSGALGINPESAIFRPYFPYVRGLDFAGIQDLTVEADGVELLCHGWMEPLSLAIG
jgi:xanthine dehydrogenase molybdopterin-binding subunit B